MKISGITALLAIGAVATGEKTSKTSLRSLDAIVGTDGADTIKGTSKSDQVTAKGGDDVVAAGKGDDVVFGGAGDDTLYGGTDDDSLYGGTGDDILVGGSGNDKVSGARGNDQLFAGPGFDILLGGDGDDILYAGSGDLSAEAGPGNDQVRVSFEGPSVQKVISMGEGLDKLQLFGLRGGDPTADMSLSEIIDDFTREYRIGTPNGSHKLLRLHVSSSDAVEKLTTEWLSPAATSYRVDILDFAPNLCVHGYLEAYEEGQATGTGDGNGNGNGNSNGDGTGDGTGDGNNGNGNGDGKSKGDGNNGNGNGNGNGNAGAELPNDVEQVNLGKIHFDCVSQIEVYA